MNLPPRTVVRLSKYRRLLAKTRKGENAYIFSHHLAKMLNLTPVQVRRDLMLIGLSGNHRKGYSIGELIMLIGKTIDREEGHHLAIVGMGNLGRAVTRFIRKSEAQMDIVAGFDIDPKKIDIDIDGVPCYHISNVQEQIRSKGIEIVVLTSSAEAAQSITDVLIESGVKGILNFTSEHLDVPGDIYLINYDIMTSLEEIGFFIKNPNGEVSK
jgi:redox-sensing transcriptional repressor